MAETNEPLLRNTSMKMILVAIALVGMMVGCSPQMNPAARAQFEDLTARADMLAVKCIDPNQHDPACDTGWQVFADQCHTFLDIMDEGVK